MVPARHMKGADPVVPFPEQQRLTASTVIPLETQDDGVWQMPFASRTISAGQPQAPS